MKLFGDYLKSRRGVLLFFALAAALLGVSFALFHLPLRAVAYPCTLALLLGLAALALDFRRVYKLHRELSQLETTAAELIGVLPAAASVPETDYQAIVQSLCRQSADAAAKAAADRADMLEYYTLWAHQIKTPIAAMRLRLQSEDSDSSRRLLADLGRIEQYVEMVLTYLRLEGEGTDYVFREAKLDDIVRPALRRFAGEFIARRLTLDYTPADVRVFTDEKWLSFVIEQVLSNALKYTPQGGVSVYVEEPKTLCIRDTGSALRRRICRASLSAATPACRGARTSARAASGSISAAASAGISATRSRRSRAPARGRQSGSNWKKRRSR